MMRQNGKTLEVKGIFSPETGVFSTTEEDLTRAKIGLLHGDSVITSDRQFKLCFRDSTSEEKVRLSNALTPNEIRATPCFAPTRFYIIRKVDCLTPLDLIELKISSATNDSSRYGLIA
jgi:UDP-2,3-diacylglucosamine pyrophosphatase LpxH